MDGGLESASDQIVVGRAADGDAAAFGVLVRRYGPLMRAYARNILPGTADVDDVVQDAFIMAWERLAELRNPAKVKSWLMRIVSRGAVDCIRSTRPHLDLDSIHTADAAAVEHASPTRVAEARAGVSELSATLRELPDTQRECWVLRELGEYNYEEIAAELEIPLSTVRGLLARARKYIIVRMEQWR